MEQLPRIRTMDALGLLVLQHRRPQGCTGFDVRTGRCL